MAVKALDIVSLKRMKLELRFPDEDNGHDEFITDLIKSAVSYVSADLSIPLLDTRVYKDVRPVNPNNPVVIDDQYARELIELRSSGVDMIEGYYPNLLPSDDYTADTPTSAIWLRDKIVIKYPWDVNQLYRVIYTRGIPDNLIVRYQTPVVLMVRSAYNGEAMSSPNSAYDRIVGQLKSYTANPAGIIEARN